MEIFIDIVIAVKGHAVIVAGLGIVHRRASIVAAADKVKFFENDLCHVTLRPIIRSVIPSLKAAGDGNLAALAQVLADDFTLFAPRGDVKEICSRLTVPFEAAIDRNGK